MAFYEFKNVNCLHLLLVDIKLIFCITYALLLMFSVYVHVYRKIKEFDILGPKCGKWDYVCLKIWEVGLWVSKNVGSGTFNLSILYLCIWGLPPPHTKTHTHTHVHNIYTYIHSYMSYRRFLYVCIY